MIICKYDHWPIVLIMRLHNLMEVHFFVRVSIHSACIYVLLCVFIDYSICSIQISQYVYQSFCREVFPASSLYINTLPYVYIKLAFRRVVFFQNVVFVQCVAYTKFHWQLSVGTIAIHFLV